MSNVELSNSLVIRFRKCDFTVEHYSSYTRFDLLISYFQQNDKYSVV